MFTPNEILLTILKIYPGLFAKAEVQGCIPLPRGPKIIAANHTLASDALQIPLALDEKLYFLLQANLFQLPIVGRLLKLDGHIPVKPKSLEVRDCLRQARDVLSAGGSIVIFPEGRLVPPGSRVRARSGVMRLAAHTGVPIIPLGIYVPPQDVLKMSTHWLGQKRTGLWQISGKCHLNFGAPWRPAAHEYGPIDLQVQTEALMKIIYSLVEETQKELACVSPTLLNPIPQ